jgi:glycosyltransferase involved in cell wall biosynthesis
MNKKTVAIITPVYNDWASFHKLAQAIDDALASTLCDVTLVAIDDCSTQAFDPALFAAETFRVIRHIEVVHLVRNSGHQRAIAIGLSYFEKNCQADHIVVMDADGEDRPADLPALIAQTTLTNEIVFAKRGQRKESLIFQLFSRLYRSLFIILIGRPIPLGNFCVIPSYELRRVVFLPEIWRHFPAGILHSGLPHSAITIDRGKRYFGKSKMNFVGLIIHGLSAFSVYTDVLSVRMMLLTLFVIVAAAVGSGVLLYLRYFTPLVTPSWAIMIGFGLLVLMLQSFLLLLSMAFSAINSRAMQIYIPAKHYQDFVLNVEVCYEQK